jgi:hypothetical protein
MALISKPGFQCRLSNSEARSHHKARSIKLAHRTETSGACSKGSAKLARERPSIETSDAFEFRGRMSDGRSRGNQISNT